MSAQKPLQIRSVSVDGNGADTIETSSKNYANRTGVFVLRHLNFQIVFFTDFKKLKKQKEKL